MKILKEGFLGKDWAGRKEIQFLVVGGFDCCVFDMGREFETV